MNEPDERPSASRPRRRSARQWTITAHAVAAEAVVAMIIRRPLLSVSIAATRRGRVRGCTYRPWRSATGAEWPRHRMRAAAMDGALARIVGQYVFTGRWPRGWRHGPRMRLAQRIARDDGGRAPEVIAARIGATAFVILGYTAAIEKVAYGLSVNGTVAAAFVRSAIDDVLTGSAWDA